MYGVKAANLVRRAVEGPLKQFIDPVGVDDSDDMEYCVLRVLRLQSIPTKPSMSWSPAVVQASPRMLRREAVTRL